MKSVSAKPAGWYIDCPYCEFINDDIGEFEEDDRLQGSIFICQSCGKKAHYKGVEC